MNDPEDIPILEVAEDQPVANKTGGGNGRAATDALHWTAAEDPDMARAIKAAQASFAEFARHAELEHFRVVPGFTHVGVKAFFANPKRPGSGEHMFVEDIATDGVTITGTLNSTPHAIPNLHEGQRVTFPISDLSDWFLVCGDKGLGGFTIDVMKRQMDPDELQQYESQPPLAWYRHRVKLDAIMELERIPVCNKCGHRDLIATSYKEGLCGLCANGATRTKCPSCGAPLIRNSNQPRKCAACLKPKPPTEPDSPPLIGPDDDIPMLTVADDGDTFRLSRPVTQSKPRRAAQAPIKVSPLSEVTKSKPSSNHRVWLWVGLGSFGVVSFITLAVLVIRMSGRDDAKKVVEQIHRHPLVLEKLGGIEECEMNFLASLNEGGKNTDVFNVRGPKGSGQFVTHERFFSYDSIKLRTAEGEWELLDGRENGVAQNSPTVPTPTFAPPTTPVLPSPQPAPITVPPGQANQSQLPRGSSIATATTPLKPGTPIFALMGTSWPAAEVLAVRPNGTVVVHWPHLGHDMNRAMPRSAIAVSDETLAKLQNDPNAFSPSVELIPDTDYPPPDGHVVLPKNLKLLPGMPVKVNPAGRLMLDYTFVREEVGEVFLLRDQLPVREEKYPRKKLVIQKSIVEQLSEPDAEQKFAARLKEVQAKNPLARTSSPNVPTPAGRARPARTYQITIPVPETHERVTKDTPLEIGTRCSAEWGRRWNLVTVKALRDNGDVEVHWDGWSTIEPVTRDSLTIDKKTLAELEAKRKPEADPKRKDAE